MALPHYCSGRRLWPMALRAWVESINTARYHAGLPMVTTAEIERMTTPERLDALSDATRQARERDRLVAERGLYADADAVRQEDDE